MDRQSESKNIELIYCVKCRKLVAVKDPEMITMASSRPALTGKCPHCYIKVYKIVSK